MVAWYASEEGDEGASAMQLCSQCSRCHFAGAMDFLLTDATGSFCVVTAVLARCSRNSW